MKKCLVLAFVLGTASLAVADKTWSGSGDGKSWTDGANWGGSVPTSSEIAVVSKKGLVLDLGGTTCVAKKLNVGANLTLTNGTLKVSNGGKAIYTTAACTLCFADVTLQGAGSGDNIRGANNSTWIFCGECKLEKVTYLFTYYNADVWFKDGVTTSTAGISGNSDSQTGGKHSLHFANARASFSEIPCFSKGSYPIDITLGANNISDGDAVLTSESAATFGSDAKLVSVDASAVGAGVYTLVKASSLTGGATMIADTAVTVGKDSSGKDFTYELAASDTAITLTIKSEGPIEPGVGTFEEIDIHSASIAAYMANSDPDDVGGATGTQSLELPLTKTISTSSGSQSYVNLRLGERVVYTNAAGCLSYFVVTSTAPRTIALPLTKGGSTYVYNVRDLGGWPLAGSTNVTRQGVFYRGGKLDGFASVDINWRTNNLLHTQLGVKSEIELRPASEDGSLKNKVGLKYYHCPFETTVGADGDWRNLSNEVTRANICKIFTALAEPSNRPAYWHCSIGRDRTGLVAQLVHLLCGVKDEAIYRDFMLSNFANCGGATKPLRFNERLAFLRAGVPGHITGRYKSGLQGRTREYLEWCGVTAAQLESITLALTGEKLDKVTRRVRIPTLIFLK